MTDLDHLKECYIEHRAEMKRGYGVHSVGVDANPPSSSNLYKMIDRLPIRRGGHIYKHVKEEIEQAINNRFSIMYRLNLKDCISQLSKREKYKVFEIVKRECK